MHPPLRTALSLGAVTVPVAAPVLTRRPRLLRLVATVSTATTAGLSLAHTLERPGKMSLPIQQWWELSDQLYRPWFGVAGHGEGIALIALPALAAVDRDARRTLLAAWMLLLIANPGVFMSLVAPTNRATRQSPANPPPNAAELRARWERGHVARFVCHAAAFVLLAWRDARHVPAAKR